jgi:WD40 repeat protein
VLPADAHPPAAGPATWVDHLPRILAGACGAVAGLVLVGSVAAAGLVLWGRTAYLPDLGAAPSAARGPAEDAASRGGRFPQPPGATRAFDAHGAVRVIALGYTADAAALVTVGRDGAVKLWGLKSGDLLAKHLIRNAATGGAGGAAFAPDGQTLAVAVTQGTPRLLGLPSLEERPTLPGGERGGVRCVGFARSGRLAACDAIGFRVWEDGRLLLTSLRVPAGPLLAFAPDGNTLALGGDAIRVYDAQTGREQAAYRRGGGLLTGLAYAPDGSLLAGAGGDGVVTLWGTAGQEQGRLQHPSAVHAIAFTPDGRRLVAGTDTAALHTWAVAGGRSLGVRTVFQTPTGTTVPWFGGARAIAFRPDGQEFAVACGGAVAIYPIDVLPAE